MSNTLREVTMIGVPARGGALTFDIHAQGNHTVWSALAWAPAEQRIPGLGWLWVDPNQSVLLGVTAFPRAMSQTYSLPIPNLPWLAGVAVGIQALDVDGFTGAAQLTNRPHVVIQ